mmetsp:Transcript_16594/g.42426  ORF Transcript_16594/g.42426 Transcript_16594/m.42426 type:complete len:208 (+) Transcript_16594:551-1174(+)
MLGDLRDAFLGGRRREIRKETHDISRLDVQRFENGLRGENLVRSTRLASRAAAEVPRDGRLRRNAERIERHGHKIRAVARKDLKVVTGTVRGLLVGLSSQLERDMTDASSATRCAELAWCLVHAERVDAILRKLLHHLLRRVNTLGEELVDDFIRTRERIRCRLEKNASFRNFVDHLEFRCLLLQASALRLECSSRTLRGRRAERRA